MKCHKIIISILIALNINAISQVTCDEFNVEWDFEENQLKLELKTDIPDYTDIIVSVSRSYVLKENNQTYSVDYFNEKSTVKAWRKVREITIDNDKWNHDFEKDLKKAAAFELGTKAKSISNDIEIRFVIPARQTNPTFGKWNSKLTGKMVNDDGLRIVEKEFSFSTPLASSIKSTSFTLWNSLEKNHIYKISKNTPLMPEFEPNAITSIFSKPKTINSGSMIRIIEIKMKRDFPWYNVELLDTDYFAIYEGWVNGKALMGQEIIKIK